MFGLEAVADLFDKIHADNRRFISKEFQGWVNSVYRSEGESWRFYGAAATASAADALYTFAGGVGAGFVDLLRIGEGTKGGSLWGMAQDGLRLVTVVGGAFRVVRVAYAGLEIGGPMSCVVSANAKAGVLAGRWFNLNTLFDRLAGLVGGRAHVLSASFPGLTTQLEFVDFFRMFTRTTVMSVNSLDEVVNAARVANGPVVFAVAWKNGIGHAMVAFRDLFGRVRFADQTGKLASASDITGAMQSVYGEIAVLHEALVVQVMRGGTILHLLASQLNVLHPNGMLKLEENLRSKQTPQRR